MTDLPNVLVDVLADPKARNLDHAMNIVRKRPGSLTDADLKALVVAMRAQRAQRVVFK